MKIDKFDEIFKSQQNQKPFIDKCGTGEHDFYFSKTTKKESGLTSSPDCYLIAHTFKDTY